MTQLKFVIGVMSAYAAYYTIQIIRDFRRRKPEMPSLAAVDHLKSDETPVRKSESSAELEAGFQAKNVSYVLTQDTVLKSLWAYDNSDHKSLVHVRFDKQTVDLMNKFKMATGTDITKFVAFSVKYFFETNPELKLIIKRFIQNTEL